MISGLPTHATSLLFNGESFLFATSHAVPSSTVETGVFEMDLSIVFDVPSNHPPPRPVNTIHHHQRFVVLSVAPWHFLVRSMRPVAFSCLFRIRTLVCLSVVPWPCSGSCFPVRRGSVVRALVCGFGFVHVLVAARPCGHAVSVFLRHNCRACADTIPHISGIRLCVLVHP
ncbi:hypothetical protein CPB85DRAFT_1029219 [Mucidula mucida]|nr:hypothetical protein CPB85DRAFT_1029219 [Mucidula mucida]